MYHNTFNTAGNSGDSGFVSQIDKLTIAPADRPELLALAQWQQDLVKMLDAAIALNGKAGVLAAIDVFMTEKNSAGFAGAIQTAQPTARNGAA